MPEEQISEQLDKIDEQASKMGAVATLLKNTLVSIVFGGIISLIIGAIMKKNPEIFDNNTGGVI